MLSYFGSHGRSDAGVFSLTAATYTTILAACIAPAQANGLEPEELASSVSLAMHESWTTAKPVVELIGYGLDDYVAAVIDATIIEEVDRLTARGEVDFTTAGLDVFGSPTHRDPNGRISRG
jgi:hypothetical protein